MNIKLIGCCYFIDDEEPSLEWIQETLGGYMEVVILRETGRQMLVNDIGALIPLQVNELATNINMQEGNGDTIYGDVIILSGAALLT